MPWPLKILLAIWIIELIVGLLLIGISEVLEDRPLTEEELADWRENMRRLRGGE